MSIFGNILKKIFPGNHPAVSDAGTATPTSTAPASAPAAAPATPMPEVDVEAVLTALAAKNSQTLNWRTSIVDLMKLLSLASDLNTRKELAKELGYAGDMGDSAAMNIWLHKQVMSKLAKNGGKVPDDLKD